MYAIVKISGEQFDVTPSQKLYVPHIQSEEGDILTFSDLLLFANESSVKVGNPFLSNASVQARVIGHFKDDKVIVFKKKRRKGYRVKRGHRQIYTQLQITSIVG
ncbi:MAG: 50S ribosomal protein L21 [Bacteroidetes bacterium]|nr:50S ribosomal protein L21 [Bacteroidota bacterium]